MLEFKRKPIQGVLALMPLCLKENQEIDYEGIRWNVKWLEDKGIQGFIQFGCMGQMHAVSEDEFNRVCDLCVDASKDKKITCVVSTTATTTREATRRAKYAEDAGADGAMLLLPYAFPVHDDDCAVEFFQTVDEALKGELAIILYNYAGTCRFNIQPHLWERLLKIRSIKALKDSNFTISDHDEVLLKVAKKINCLSAAEPFFWHDAMLGAKGIVGTITWVAPKVLLKYYEECMKGHQMESWTLRVYKTLVSTFGLMMRLEQAPLALYEHGYLNALAEIGGAKGGPPRKPYNPLPREARNALERVVRPLLEMEKELE